MSCFFIYIFSLQRSYVSDTFKAFGHSLLYVVFILAQSRSFKFKSVLSWHLSNF